LVTACSGSGAEESISDDFDTVLHDVIGGAQRSCPTFHLPPDVFIAYLRERLPLDLPPPIALRRMHTADLYLACGCARGDPSAIAAFDEQCLGRLDRALSKNGIDRDTIAEVKQEIRYRVLVGDGGHAEIIDFSGRGDLRGWVRVMAMRQALRHQSQARRNLATVDDELGQRLVSSEAPEVDHLKEVYRHKFKHAFEAALRALPHREQTLLRQHYVDGATLDELAQLYRVHRSTVARLLSRAREMVIAATRDHLMSQLEVPPEEIDSILRMIRSQIEISLRALRRVRRR